MSVPVDVDLGSAVVSYRPAVGKSGRHLPRTCRRRRCPELLLGARFAGTSVSATTRVRGGHQQNATTLSTSRVWSWPTCCWLTLILRRITFSSVVKIGRWSRAHTASLREDRYPHRTMSSRSDRVAYPPMTRSTFWPKHLGVYPAGNADTAGLADEQRANRVGKPGISPRAAC